MTDNGFFDTVTVDRVEYETLKAERDEFRQLAEKRLTRLQELERECARIIKERDLCDEARYFEAAVVTRILQARRAAHYWSHSDRDTIDELILNILRDNSAHTSPFESQGTTDIPF